MPLPRFDRDPEAGVVAGVCAGIARTLGVDPTVIRLIFALLALAGGAGILLYLAMWAYEKRRSPWLVGGLGVIAVSAVLGSLGLSNRVVAGIALVVAGLVVVWRRGGFASEGASLSIAGATLAAAGAVLVLSHGGVHASVLTPGAIGGSLLLVGGPLVWRLAFERDAERAARIRSEERSDLATRVHDSVLQTLALIQRHAEDPRRTSALARRQERELRSWIYGEGEPTAESLLTLLSAAAADVEELHGVRVELASSGDCPAGDSVRALALAAREAMTNGAKHSGAEEVDVFAETTEDRVSVFVRDRGSGFDASAVPAGRRGISDSIVGRMERAGGAAAVTSAPGEGTEVELSLPRSAS
jgi:signal transduction histidine kinase